MTKQFKYSLLGIGCITILTLIALSFRNALWVDPCVILSEMESIADGYVPYKTMHLNYPPLYFYLMVVLKKLFSVPYGCYEFYLFVHYLFSFGCGALIYGISREFGIGKGLSMFASYLWMFISLWLIGDCVIFEIPAVFFGLSASYMVLKGKRLYVFFLAGILAACSFLVKQFGAGFSLLTLYLIVFFHKSGIIKKSASFCLGYFIPVAVCLIIWGGDFINSVLLNGYGGDTFRELAQYDSSYIALYLKGMFWVCTRFPVVPLTVVLFPIAVREKHWQKYLYCFCGIAGFALQFCFMTIFSFKLVSLQYHYVLFLLPFIIMLCCLLLSHSNGKRFIRLISMAAVTVTCLYSAYKVCRFTVPGYLDGETRKTQEQLVRKVSEMIPEGKTVWVVDGKLEFLYYLAHLHPADMKNFAFSTGCFEITPDEAKAEMRQADYAILFDWGVPSDWWRNYYDEEVNDYITSHSSQYLGEVDGEKVLLYELSD